MNLVSLPHVIDVYERGGRFGEDVLSVRCRHCKKIWTDEPTFSKERIGDLPCPARAKRVWMGEGL